MIQSMRHLPIYDGAAGTPCTKCGDRACVVTIPAPRRALSIDIRRATLAEILPDGAVDISALVGVHLHAVYGVPAFKGLYGGGGSGSSHGFNLSPRL